jgi:hypothetical protein
LEVQLHSNLVKGKLVLIILLSTAFFSQATTVNFYGHTIFFENASVANLQIPSRLQQANVSQLSARMQHIANAKLLNDFATTQQTYDLDNMGMVLLVQAWSKQMHSNSSVQNLAQYTVLKKLNIKVLLTFTSEQLSCFGVLKNQPASSVYIYYGGIRYTNLDFKNKSLMGNRFIFTDADNDSYKVIDVLAKKPKLNAHITQRALLWVYNKKTYQLTAKSNASLMAYLNDLPEYELGERYVVQEGSKAFKESVIDGLREYSNEFTSLEDKANFLLSFVQHAFQYQTDQDQYGQEKYNYPEETVVSAFSDCEDRTLLLAYLYKDILHVESIILYFKDAKHVCLAANIPRYRNGYSLQYQGLSYQVCEPTGYGFKVGDVSTPLSGITEVIEL